MKARRMISHGNILGAGFTNLFGVFEVLEESVLVPSDTLAYIGGGV